VEARSRFLRLLLVRRVTCSVVTTTRRRSCGCPTFRDLVADDARATQVIDDVTAALGGGRHCLELALWAAHVERFAENSGRCECGGCQAAI
jgi:hypothetical protein